MEALKLLLDHGADVNVKDVSGFPPLSYAVLGYNVIDADIAKVLIERGADVNLPNNVLETPIFYAFNLSCLHILLDNGADINALNIYGKTVLMTPLSYNNEYLLPIVARFAVLENYYYDSLKDNPGFIINSKIINKSENMKKMRDECNQEISELKNIKLHPDYAADVFILNNDPDLFSKLVYHNDVESLPSKFKIYKKKIERSISLGKERLSTKI
ncbi:ankyrin repeat protein [Cheloniid poxvirus 1]|nr:ankyrin repeat protein [Cheloniid poxvirus 1]QRM15639.1 ankyrin repeat protein [Penguinpox virus 2]QRM15969.1 ankyrin repeat protein [Albatrosspox virus]